MGWELTCIFQKFSINVIRWPARKIRFASNSLELWMMSYVVYSSWREKVHNRNDEATYILSLYSRIEALTSPRQHRDYVECVVRIRLLKDFIQYILKKQFYTFSEAFRMLRHSPLNRIYVTKVWLAPCIMISFVLLIVLLSPRCL